MLPAELAELSVSRKVWWLSALLTAPWAFQAIMDSVGKQTECLAPAQPPRLSFLADKNGDGGTLTFQGCWLGTGTRSTPFRRADSAY